MNGTQGHLYEALSTMRSNMMRRIASSLPKGSIAIGPVLIFIEDPYTGCLYCWTSITWNDLKLGNLLREILRDVLDLTIFVINKLELSSFPQKKIEPLNRLYDIRSICKKFIKFDLANMFDDWPVFKEFKIDINDIKDFNISLGNVPGTKKAVHLFEDLISNLEFCVNQINNGPFKEIGIELESQGITHISYSSLPQLLNTLYEVNMGRFVTFIDLKHEIINMGKDYLNHIGEYMQKHPKFTDDSSKEDVLNIWNNFIEEIKAYKHEKDIVSPKVSTYQQLMEKALSIFCNLPQEISSSASYSELKRINAEEYSKRLDLSRIRLSDLAYHPKDMPYDITYLKGGEPYTHKKRFPFYSITLSFERLFYLSRPDRVETEITLHNIIFIPIKFLDFQVKGQVVVISFEPIDRGLILNVAEASLPKVQAAAKKEFEARLISAAFIDAKRIIPNINELSYLVKNIGVFINFLGSALFKRTDSKWTIFHYLTSISNPDEVANCGSLTKNERQQDAMKQFCLWFSDRVDNILISRHKYSVFTLSTKDNVPFPMYEKTVGNSGQPSCFILVHDNLAILLLFNEPLTIVNLSAKELYLSITAPLDTITLIKEKQLSEYYMSSVSHIGHEVKQLSGIITDIGQLINNIKNTNISDIREVLENIEFNLIGYRNEINFILSANHASYKSMLNDYQRPEIKSYNILKFITNTIEKRVLKDSFVLEIKQRIISGKEEGKKTGKIFYNIWEKLGKKIIDFRVPHTLHTYFNERSLELIINALIQNAFIHTNWNHRYFNKQNAFSPAVIVDAIQDDEADKVRLLVSNLPNKYVQVNRSEIFYEEAKTTHILMIGKAVEIATGGKNICFVEAYKDREDLKSFISAQITIPKSFSVEDDSSERNN